MVFVEALTRRPLCGRSSEHLKRGNFYDWVRDGSCLTFVSRSLFPVLSSIFLLSSVVSDCTIGDISVHLCGAEMIMTTTMMMVSFLQCEQRTAIVLIAKNTCTICTYFSTRTHTCIYPCIYYSYIYTFIHLYIYPSATQQL